ncbi:MAG TPA: hypothetical protein VKH42_11505 [Vicinamibacterales bacterium]|nr:hypothetical protein [Vicinamibacterales bacterium]
MNALWVLIGVAVFVAAAKLVRWTFGRAVKPDLGFVSHQWVDEHRQSQTQNTYR